MARAHLLPILLLTACVVRGSAGAYEGAAESTGGPMPSTSTSTGSTTTGPKLDLGPRDVEAMECISIGQTTTIVERPSDIVVLADAGMDPGFVQANIGNLLPAIETEGVFDAQVVLVTTLAPPDDGSRFSCGAWNCRGASSFESFLLVSRPIDPGTQVLDLLDAAESWAPNLRAASWKHVWVMSSTLGTEGDADALLQQLAAATDPGVVIHAVVQQDGVGDPEGFLGLTERTSGVYAQGDFTLDAFLEPMIDRIRGTSLACEYDIPPPPAGLVFDPGEVNVDYDDGQGLQVVGYVEGAEDCTDVAGGWYYDDPVDPGQIVMCPQTCTRFDALQEASIEIRFGCTTIPAE